MHEQPAARFALALRALDLRPGQRVLEIGCGHGVAVSHLCAALEGRGHVTALDRSPAMAAAAQRRNAEAVAAGLVTVVCEAIQDARLPGTFDRVLAVRVRELWTDARVLPRVRGWLAPAGLLCIVLDSPAGAMPETAARRVRAALAASGFDEIATAEDPGGGAVALTATAAP